jgi:predicted nucleic acid-binding protein
VIREKNDLNIYYFDNTDFENIAEIFKKQQYQLSFVDASVIYLAKQTNSSIATYDEAMEKEFARCSKA